MIREIQVIPLDRAYLCVNCDCIGDNSSACQRCGSDCLISLSRILEGNTDRGEVISWQKRTLKK